MAYKIDRGGNRCKGMDGWDEVVDAYFKLWEEKKKPPIPVAWHLIQGNFV